MAADEQHGYDLGGHVERLEVENFKSYKDRCTIGPFRPFTCIVGPNGAGKSNLMDAISFVLGVRTAQLRGNLKELLYAAVSEHGVEVERAHSGYVRLVYVKQGGQEVHFTRSIVPSGSGADAAHASQFQVDEKTVTLDAYSKRLRSFGILIKAKNFLVFQGDIESYASMDARQLTERLEHISGSEQYRKDYERLEQDLHRAEEHQAFLAARKKTVHAEKRQKKEQKEEAEKHMKMQAQLVELKTQFYLWQAHNLDADVGNAQKQLAVQERQLEEVAPGGSAAEQEAEEKRREQAGLQKRRMMLDKKAKKRRLELDRKSPEVIKLREEIGRLQKRLKTGERELAEQQAAAQEQERHIAKTRQDLDNVTAAQEQLEQDEAAQSRDKVAFGAEEFAEFQRLETMAQSRTAKQQTACNTMQAAQQADQDQADTLQADLKAIQQKLEEQATEKGQCIQRRDAVVLRTNTVKQELKDATAELKKLQDGHRQAGAQRDYLSQKLADLEGQLRDVSSERKEGERERRMVQAVAELRRRLPGVHGRVTDLVKVHDKRCNLALAVALGKDMDSVIVDNKQTAQDCIKYLKDHRVPPMTFTPLAEVKATPVSAQLRAQLSGTARLAIDLLKFDGALEPAIVQYCGNTIVCDSYEEGRRLAFSGADRHRVATLDGTLFARSGLITGGGAGGMEARAGRFQDRDVQALKDAYAKHQQQLDALPAERDAVQRQQAVGATIARLQQDGQYLTGDLQATEARLKELDPEVEAQQAQVDELQPKVADLQAAMAARQAKIDDLQERINAAKDSIFADFSKRVGVANYREYKENQGRRHSERAQQKVQLSSQRLRLQNALKHELQRSLGEQAAAKRAELERERKALRELQRQDAAARTSSEKDAAELEQQERQLAELASRIRELTEEAAALRRAVQEQGAEGARVRRAHAAAAAEVERLQEARGNLLEDAQMEQVELPTVDGGAEPMEAEGGSEAPEATPAAELDYRSLKRQYRDAASKQQRAKLEAQFRADIDDRTATLARLAPNLKAVEQYAAVQEREKAHLAELEEAQVATRAAAHAFEDAKTRRHDLFMAAYEHIAGCIDAIFKDLTRSTRHPLGGQAYLSLEDSDDPYLAGTKFTTMPPGKRFMDMESLSGGEKTLSALALLFAIHNFQPSPFFVLDEIDAALDATNVARVADFIRQRSREGSEDYFQSIVISLKDNFFHKADALIGVCKDCEKGCSATLSFDLNRLGCNHSYEACTSHAPLLPEPVQHPAKFSWQNRHLPWRTDHCRVRVGKGKQAYRQAQHAVRTWQHMRLGWTDVAAAPARAGAPACVMAKVLFLWVRNPLRIVYVDEGNALLTQQDAHSGAVQRTKGRRFAVGQTTLQGHTLEGEERFSLEWHKNDDSVWYDIHVFSRPAKPLSFLTYPLVRQQQARFKHDSIAAVTAAAMRQ